MATPPSDDSIRQSIQQLVLTVDLHTTGVKQFIKLLSKEMGVELKPRKDFIKVALTDAINAMEENDEKSNDDDEEAEEARDDHDEEEEEEEAEEQPAASSGRSKKSGRGGLSEKKEISGKLAAFLGKGTTMARTDIVRYLWEYIRKNSLQNPDNKREIFLDEAMQDVFGCTVFTMFTMNKYIGAHVHPFKPVDLSTPSTPSTTPKKRRAAKSSSNEKKKRKVGTQPPYRLSPELEAVVGTDVLPRPQVVSGIWDYIKANGLQNPNDKRQILCDAKLKAVMKKDKVTMFNMNQCITPHLLEKVDKASYEYQVDDDNSE